MEAKKRLVEPFYFPGNSLGCLLVHGFTGSPSEMRFLGERLAACGWTAMGVRLAGHGTTPEDLAATTWEDWVRSVEQALVEVRRSCRKVIGIGFSMGGLIVMHLAARGMFDGIITMNAPMVLQDWGARLAYLYKPFRKFVSKPSSHTQKHSSVTQGLERFSYDRVPVASLDSLNRAIRQVRQELQNISCPTLIMQSARDKTVKPVSAKIIQKSITGTNSQIIWFKKSGHILPLGAEREEVAVMAAAFIRQFENTKYSK